MLLFVYVLWEADWFLSPLCHQQFQMCSTKMPSLLPASFCLSFSVLPSIHIPHICPFSLTSLHLFPLLSSLSSRLSRPAAEQQRSQIITKQEEQSEQ